MVRRFSPFLLAQAKHRMGAALQRDVGIEDVVQEVWAIALERLPDLRPRDGRLTPVLMKFLSSVCLHRVRHHLRRHEAQQREDPEANVLDILDEDSVGVVTRAVAREASDAVLDALEALPSEDREILVLRVIEQRPGREVAAALGLSRNAVYVRQHRALVAIRDQLPARLYSELASAAEASR